MTHADDRTAREVIGMQSHVNKTVALTGTGNNVPELHPLQNGVPKRMRLKLPMTSDDFSELFANHTNNGSSDGTKRKWGADADARLVELREEARRRQAGHGAGGKDQRKAEKDEQLFDKLISTVRNLTSDFIGIRKGLNSKKDIIQLSYTERIKLPGYLKMLQKAFPWALGTTTIVTGSNLPFYPVLQKKFESWLPSFDPVIVAGALNAVLTGIVIGLSALLNSYIAKRESRLGRRCERDKRKVDDTEVAIKENLVELAKIDFLSHAKSLGYNVCEDIDRLLAVEAKRKVMEIEKLGFKLVFPALAGRDDIVVPPDKRPGRISRAIGLVLAKLHINRNAQAPPAGAPAPQ
jgi:hypothetical protein